MIYLREWWVKWNVWPPRGFVALQFIVPRVCTEQFQKHSIISTCRRQDVIMDKTYIVSAVTVTRVSHKLVCVEFHAPSSLLEYSGENYTPVSHPHTRTRNLGFTHKGMPVNAGEKGTICSFSKSEKKFECVHK